MWPRALPRRAGGSIEALFVAQADWIVGVVTEGRNALETGLLVQADGGVLMDTCLQSEHPHAVAHGVIGEVIEQQPREAQPAAKPSKLKPVAPSRTSSKPAAVINFGKS